MNFMTAISSVALPQTTALIMAVVALLFELFYGQKCKTGTYSIVLLGCVMIAAICIGQLIQGSSSSLAFSGLLIADQLSRLLILFVAITGFAAFYYARQFVRDHEIPTGEYYVLGLISILGMIVMISAHSFLTIYLGIELLSLPLYAMVALQRGEGLATEASIKYFIMGAIASGMMLYGMSLVYGVTGSIDVAVVGSAIAKIPDAQIIIVLFAMMFILAGIGFKFAAAPFHMWAPDVYSGAPTSVTSFLGSAPKIAAFGMTVRLLLFAFPNLFYDWQILLIGMALLSIAIGNFTAIAQTNIKRLLAYSGIAHIGYMLLGLVAGTPAGSAASLFYIINYGVMTVAGFGMLVLLSRSGADITTLDDLKGLNSRNPWLAFLMLIVFFSMAGIPPTVGFFAKLFVLKALIDVQLTWVAVVALMLAVLGAFYYLRLIKTMYFDTSEQPAFKVSIDQQAVISVNSLALLVLGLFPGLLYQLCVKAF